MHRAYMERIRIQEEQFRNRMLKMQTDHFGKVAADEEKYNRLMKEKEQMKIQVMEEI